MTRLDYCQYLFSSQINYKLTNFAEHVETLSHDMVNRYLRDEKLTPALIWEHTKGDIKQSKNGFIVFDDSIFDPERDGKSNVDHLQDMLKNAIYSKQISFTTVCE